MTISLQKGGAINLTKIPNLSKVTVGAGWDPLPGNAKMDLDLVVALLTGDKLAKDADLVFFNNQNPGPFAAHGGDNRTGEGDGDDETVFLDLDKLAPTITRAAIYITIWDAVAKGQKLADLQNAFVRIVDNNGNVELGKYEVKAGADLTGYTVHFADIVKENGEWHFKAVGQASTQEFQALALSLGFPGQQAA